jgi:S1-C subfamily serine protease
LTRKKAVAVDELDTDELLLLPVGHCLRDQVLESCHEFSRPPPPGRQGNSLETLRSMVASGLGITVLPATALTARYATPLVKSIEFAAPEASRRPRLARGICAPRGGAQAGGGNPGPRSAHDPTCRYGSGARRLTHPAARRVTVSAMRRTTLYSSSPRVESPPAAAQQEAPAGSAPAPVASPAPRPWWRRVFAHHERLLLVLGGGLVAALLVISYGTRPPATQSLTQKEIDAAVLHTLETKPLPSPAAKAWQVIQPSVVRVRGVEQDEVSGGETEVGTGSGVVIVDKGIILTNLHVVAGAKRVTVTFFDGLESEASIVGLHPEHDLAVLQAKSLPDDLVAATMRSTADLAPGDRVVAVGFPFGIGPSVSAGVVSGLKREFRSPEGKRVLTNLIQFDAAANPGSSGGPLVTMEGEVVGIVTAILNPSEQRVFIGIGFAVPIENAAGAVGMHPF